MKTTLQKKYFVRSKRMFSLTIILAIIALKGYGQDLLFTDNPEVRDAFRSTVLVNVQATAIPAKQGWEFYIRHRFGAIKPDNSLFKSFLGTDLVANIQFSFYFPLGDKMFVGVGREKFGKTYNLELKRLLFVQTTDNSMPLSVALYANAGCMSDDFSPVPKYAYFADGTTEFSYSFRHRLSYNSQVLLSKKFGKYFSLELNPIFVYRNLVPIGEENSTYCLATAMAFRLTKNASILAEYTYRFNNRPVNKSYPLSLAMEFGTVGHSFQIVVSTARDLQEQQINSSETTDYKNGEFLLGFNLKRTFWNKKNKTNVKAKL